MSSDNPTGDSSPGDNHAGETPAPKYGDAASEDGEVWQSIADVPDEREHVGELYWGLLATSIVLWLSVQVGLMFALPDRVPLHWSGRTLADAWTTRLGAFVYLWTLLIIPIVLPFFSRLVLKRPLSLLVRSRRFWLGSKENRKRFERLMREDLILVSVFYMVVLAWVSFVVGLAAKNDHGAMPAIAFIVPAAMLVVSVVVLLVRGYHGKRYEPTAHLDLDPPETPDSPTPS